MKPTSVDDSEFSAVIREVRSLLEKGWAAEELAARLNRIIEVTSGELERGRRMRFTPYALK